MSRLKLLLALTGVLLAVAVAVVLAAPSLYEIESRNYPVPYEDAGRVYKLRVLDSVDVYAPEELRDNASLDVITGLGLVGLATAALMSAALLSAAGRDRPLVRFYGLVGAGALFLGLDEMLSIHETIGHNLQFLADVPGVERPDDLVLALYLIPGLAFLIYFRSIVLASERARRLIGLALGLFALSAVADLAGASKVDEGLEVLGGVSLVAGFGMLGWGHLRDGLGLTGTPEAGPQTADEYAQT